MRRRDAGGPLIRAVFLVVRAEFRTRRMLYALRHANAWLVAGVAWLVFGVAIRSWILVAAFGVLLLLTIAQWAYERHYLARAGLEDVDEMTGWEFERWLERFFEDLGFDVKRTPYRGDFGADFVLTWNGVRIAVQAKRSRRLVGVQAVQEVVAAKAYYRCEEAMVVTNSYFSDQAAILARANNVRLRFRDDLARGLAGLRSGDPSLSQDESSLLPASEGS